MEKIDQAWILGGLFVPFLSLIWSELRSMRSLLTSALATQAAHGRDIQNMRDELKSLKCKRGECNN
jgi:hypothetical protein